LKTTSVYAHAKPNDSSSRYAWEVQVRRHPWEISNFRLACHQKQWGRPGQFVVMGEPRLVRMRGQMAAAATPVNRTERRESSRRQN